MTNAGFSDNFAFSYETFLEFFRTGGWFIAPILLCWFISVTVLIWKALDLRRRFLLPPDLAADVAAAAAGPLSHSRATAIASRLEEQSASVLGRVCLTAIQPRHQTAASATRATETLAREEISRLERGIPVLEIIFTIAPMLGLIGTVSGLVRIFASLGSGTPQSAEQARQIALGIAEAMNTTIAGLVVAVPALIGQVLYSRHIERQAHRLSTLATAFLENWWSHGSPALPSAPAPGLPSDPSIPARL